MSDLIKVTYEIQVKDETKFRDFYASLGEVAHYSSELVRVEQLIEDFIICQDMYKEKSQHTFTLEEVGLELVDSYSKVEQDQDMVYSISST